ncbi:MAG: hypothetical protein V2B14_05500, partial [bacterium]
EIMRQQDTNTTFLVTSDQITRQINLNNQELEVNKLIDTINTSKDNIIEKVSRLIDEKLDGIDEIIVELIKCKSENEKLKQKLNQLTKDNYKLKNEAESFKPLKFGLYIKKEGIKFINSSERKYIKI